MGSEPSPGTPKQGDVSMLLRDLNLDWSDSIVSRVLSLHIVNPDSISGNHMLP